ncbi:MAG TPA: hypothetical protein VN428_02275 [Bryobacteraceae bacterium]|nr:hypothetical protein [Bryobacteraceae bacterium]
MKAQDTRRGGRHCMHERESAEIETPPVAIPEYAPARAPLLDCALSNALNKGLSLEAAVAVLHAAMYED